MVLRSTPRPLVPTIDTGVTTLARCAVPEMNVWTSNDPRTPVADEPAAAWWADVDAWEAVVRCDVCAWCGEPGGTVDHILPRQRTADSVDRRSSWTNMTGACDRCNHHKSDASLLDMLLNGDDPLTAVPTLSDVTRRLTRDERDARNRHQSAVTQMYLRQRVERREAGLIPAPEPGDSNHVPADVMRACAAVLVGEGVLSANAADELIAEVAAIGLTARRLAPSRVVLRLLPPKAGRARLIVTVHGLSPLREHVAQARDRLAALTW